MPYGRTVLYTSGQDYQVTADGKPEWKTGGVTIDWATVTAAGSAGTTLDGIPYPAGAKFIERGTVLLEETSGGNAGQYGLYASGATDGRQTLARDRVGVLNQTIFKDDPTGFGAGTDHTGLIVGGRVKAAMLQVGGAGQPTLANVEAVLPRLSVVRF